MYLDVIPKDEKTINMKYSLRIGRLKFRHLGYRKQILPVVVKAMADFLLRISVNSSYVVLGIYDIASESFYKYSCADFLDKIPKHLSYPNDFSPYLKPFVSDKFKNIVYSDSHELIIGCFYRYYNIRLPALVYYGRYFNWPHKIGVSEDDLLSIISHSFENFEEYFPIAAQKLIGNGPEDYNSIFSQYSDGKQMAYKYNLENLKMKSFLYQSEDIWREIVEYIPKLNENRNIFLFVETIFKSNFSFFWESYRLDYMDTLRHWDMAGAFEGHKRALFQGFWDELEKSLDRNEFIFRTADPY
jgi:hypothetical protein